MVFEAIDPEKIRKLMLHLFKLATEEDDTAAAKILLERVLGRPDIKVQIDDARESKLRDAVKAMPLEALELLTGLSAN